MAGSCSDRTTRSCQHNLRDVGFAGSNPVTPTIKNKVGWSVSNIVKIGIWSRLKHFLVPFWSQFVVRIDGFRAADKTLARFAATSKTDDDFVKLAPKFVSKYALHAR